eukprot:CAMPEP_0178941608 /NCGR_PEP_ID=MMETSP0789-20121207/1502_1 /TAXON_ID=3005 /ORGANISM="Rhizosolenia setigera, Strain CCMP 1694" /LENGTH=189 /DNA_ID=CAMNT_0020620863 /DNA_START=240 /DNA_END=809 /DNA_ORIENTATION=-
MTSSVFTAKQNVRASSICIYNSTFENNTFSYKSDENESNIKRSRGLGVIHSFPTLSPYAKINIHIEGSLFYNNTFLMDSNDVGLTSSAVINLFSPVTALEVKDTEFVENKGYSSALILLDAEDKNETLQEFKSNRFYDNAASKEYGVLSCVLNYRESEFVRQQREIIHTNIHVEETCADYDYFGEKNIP